MLPCHVVILVCDRNTVTVSSRKKGSAVRPIQRLRLVHNWMQVDARPKNGKEEEAIACYMAQAPQA